LFRNTLNGNDDPRVREAVLREENTWLRKENTRLELEHERLKQLYSEARAGLRQATGCETPSPNVRRGQTPQQRAFDAGLREGQQDRPPITNGRGNILDIRENAAHLGEIQRETVDERYERELARLQGDNKRKLGLVIFTIVMLSISMMLFFHPILLTWLLNWEIR